MTFHYNNQIDAHISREFSIYPSVVFGPRDERINGYVLRDSRGFTISAHATVEEAKAAAARL